MLCVWTVCPKLLGDECANYSCARWRAAPLCAGAVAAHNAGHAPNGEGNRFDNCKEGRGPKGHVLFFGCVWGANSTVVPQNGGRKNGPEARKGGRPNFAGIGVAERFPYLLLALAKFLVSPASKVVGGVCKLLTPPPSNKSSPKMLARLTEQLVSDPRKLADAKSASPTMEKRVVGKLECRLACFLTKGSNEMEVKAWRGIPTMAEARRRPTSFQIIPTNKDRSMPRGRISTSHGAGSTDVRRAPSHSGQNLGDPPFGPRAWVSGG